MGDKTHTKNIFIYLLKVAKSGKKRMSGRTNRGGFGCWHLTGGGLGTGVGDGGHQDHLWFVGARRQVGVGHAQFPGDQGAGLVPKVPVEGDVGGAQVLAGVVEPDVEGDGPVLDEALVVLVDVVDLAEGDGEGDLI